MEALPTRSFLLDGAPVPYRLRLSSRCRRMGLRFSDAGLEVVAPPRLEHASPDPLFRRFASWIRRQLRRQAQRERERTAVGGGLVFRGKPLALEVRETDLLAGFNSAAIDGDVLVVEVPRGRADLAPAAARAFLFDHAKREIAACVKRRSEQMQQPYGRVRIGDQKSLWGSCSPRSGTLSFNARLIMAPPGALDYLVVHELAHFRWSGHGVRFWERVAKFCPDFKVHRRWLRENAWRLILPVASENLVQ